MTAAQRLRDRLRAAGSLLASAAITGVWAALALRSPMVTYHFAPALAAAAWPVTARVVHGQATSGAAVGAAAGGLVITLLATIALSLIDALRGPVLVGGNATGESVLFAVVAAIWGARALSRPRPGLIIRALSNKPA